MVEQLFEQYWKLRLEDYRKNFKKCYEILLQIRELQKDLPIKDRKVV